MIDKSGIRSKPVGAPAPATGPLPKYFSSLGKSEKAGRLSDNLELLIKVFSDVTSTAAASYTIGKQSLSVRKQHFSIGKQSREQSLSIEKQSREQSLSIEKQSREQSLSIEKQSREQSLSIEKQSREQSLSIEKQSREQSLSIEKQSREQSFSEKTGEASIEQEL